MTIASGPMTAPAAPSPAIADALRRVDEIADSTFAGWHVPGLAYGVVLGDQLIHTRGLGTLRVGEESTPTAASIFRIASMTKSFTAATVLLLRDEGELRLDDEIVAYVPEMAGVRLPTRDSPPITIRHLLTMTAGFPTDDPWGDRQQGLDIAAFQRLLAGGLSFAWAPGTRFEYSNTGYGILGRLITNVAGQEYRDVVRQRLLEPLGMASTGFEASEFPAERIARGYLWRDGQMLDEPMDRYGALASMGGVYSTVEDLARWVIGFLDATPPRDDLDVSHPLSRASRREMQQPVVPIELRVTHKSADAAPEAEIMGYGFGLFVIGDTRFGRIVSHSGGYPGFGSNMRWHPGTGLGVVALTNHRYGPATPLARELLLALLAADATPVRRTRPEARTAAARDAVERLLSEWDDEAAADLFAMNVELDEPVALRKATAATLRERHGALRRDPSMPDESATAFHLAWWLIGERGGRVRVEILLSPEAEPKVQTLSVTSVPEPPAELRGAAEAIAGALATPGAQPMSITWPAGVTTTKDVDLEHVLRAMRATEARYGPVRLGACTAGDGETKATFRLESDRGLLDLALEREADGKALTSISIVPARLEAPHID